MHPMRVDEQPPSCGQALLLGHSEATRLLRPSLEALACSQIKLQAAIKALGRAQSAAAGLW